MFVLLILTTWCYGSLSWLCNLECGCYSQIENQTLNVCSLTALCRIVLCINHFLVFECEWWLSNKGSCVVNTVRLILADCRKPLWSNWSVFYAVIHTVLGSRCSPVYSMLIWNSYLCSFVCLAVCYTYVVSTSAVDCLERLVLWCAEWDVELFLLILA